MASINQQEFELSDEEDEEYIPQGNISSLFFFPFYL